MSRFGLVTGAASGMGRAVAEVLRAQGDVVSGLDRHAGEGVAALDLADSLAGDRVLSLMGRDVDFLVNAAAEFHPSDLDTTGGADWDRLYAVNLRAPDLLTRALAPGLALELWGRGCGSMPSRQGARRRRGWGSGSTWPANWPKSLMRKPL